MTRVNLGCGKKAPWKRKLVEGCLSAEVVLDLGPEKKKRHHEKKNWRKVVLARRLFWINWWNTVSAPPAHVPTNMFCKNKTNEKKYIPNNIFSKNPIKGKKCDLNNAAKMSLPICFTQICHFFTDRSVISVTYNRHICELFRVWWNHTFVIVTYINFYAFFVFLFQSNEIFWN